MQYFKTVRYQMSPDLDEPTGELDSRSGREILSLLRQLAAQEDTTIVVDTHDPMVFEYVVATYELSDGQLRKV